MERNILIIEQKCFIKSIKKNDNGLFNSFIEPIKKDDIELFTTFINSIKIKIIKERLNLKKKITKEKKQKRSLHACSFHKKRHQKCPNECNILLEENNKFSIKN